MKAARLLLLVSVSVLAVATTVAPASIEHLAAESSHVVLARAVASYSGWNASHTRIYTYTRFSALRSIKGSISQTFTVKSLGGHADGYTMKVAGVRGWRPGETSVLFLRPAGDGTFFVTGLMQGDFRVNQQPSGQIMVSNGVQGVKELNSSGQVGGFRATRLTLQELVQRVKKAGAQ